MLTEQAPAKINLILDVTGRRPDGYHTICSVMQTVDLCDTLTVTAGEGLSLFCDDPAIPTDRRNTIIKAAEAFYGSVGLSPHIALSVQKRIPVGGGMGGESADAAATLRLLNRFEGTNLTTAELCKIGATVGADVPFCVAAGTCLVEGIGERITPLPPLKGVIFAVAKPQIGVETKSAYAAIDREWDRLCHPDTEAALAALRSGDLPAFGKTMDNIFEQTAEIPAVAEIRQMMKKMDALGSTMTGSGSAVVGLFTDAAAAKKCTDALPQCETWLCRPMGGC